MTDLQSESPITEPTRNDSYEWLKQTLVTDKHGPNSADITPLMQFLEGGSDPKDNECKGPYAQIQRLCLELCDPALPSSEVKTLLQELQKKVEKAPELQSTQWMRDINDRITLLCFQKEIETLQIGITDDWQDLFLSGTEVLGSCQTIDGETRFNKCLLSYCTDAKIQMVAIKETSSGKIVSRALLKLLFYKNSKEDWAPALFLERIYSNTTSKSQENALKAIALQRAQDLGVDLYIKNEDSDPKDQEVLLTSLASSSPYEYEDGGAGVSDGKYIIKGKKLHLPEKS